MHESHFYEKEPMKIDSDLCLGSNLVYNSSCLFGERMSLGENNFKSSRFE